MYMQPIVAAKTEMRKPRAAALKLSVGAVSLPFMAIALVAYWALAAVWFTLGGGAKLTRGLYDCLVFAGGEIVGH